MGKIKQYNITRLNLFEKILFFEQFQAYMSSSIPISTTLANIKKYTNNSKIKTIAHLLLRDMDKGENFYDAILKFKTTIDPIYCNLMSLGEQAGELPQVLNDILIAVQKQRDILINIIKQSIYPAFLFFFMLIPAVLLLLFFIAPRMGKVHELMGGSIPTHILQVQNAGTFLANNWLIILIGLLGGMWGFISLIKTATKKEISLHIPIINLLVKNYNLSIFTRLLAISYAAGVPITHGTLLSAEAIPNEAMRNKLIKCTPMITKTTLTKTFASTNLFHPVMLTKLQTGEESGELDKLLREISNDIDRAMETAITAALKALEPILMLLMGGFVFFFATTIMRTIT